MTIWVILPQPSGWRGHCRTASGGLQVGVGRADAPDLTEGISLKPLGIFSLFEALSICLHLLCNVTVICPFAPYGLGHGSKTCQIWYQWGADFAERISLKPFGRLACPWASYHIRKIAGSVCAENAGNVFPTTAGLAIPTCITTRAWRTCRDARWGRCTDFPRNTEIVLTCTCATSVICPFVPYERTHGQNLSKVATTG